MTQKYRDYLFACFAEECGELVQVVGKILRFGENDYHPKTGSIPNIQLLQQEFNDLYALAEMLGVTVDPQQVEAKMKKVDHYWLYAKETKHGMQKGQEGQEG